MMSAMMCDVVGLRHRKRKLYLKDAFTRTHTQTHTDLCESVW